MKPTLSLKSLFNFLPKTTYVFDRILIIKPTPPWPVAKRIRKRDDVSEILVNKTPKKMNEKRLKLIKIQIRVGNCQSPWHFGLAILLQACQTTCLPIFGHQISVSSSYSQARIVSMLDHKQNEQQKVASASIYKIAERHRRPHTGQNLIPAVLW